MKQLQSQREDGTDDLDMKTITLDDGDAGSSGNEPSGGLSASQVYG